MDWLLLFTLALVSLQYSGSAAGNSGDQIPDSAPPGFHQALDPKTGKYFLVVDDSTSTTEKTEADKEQKSKKVKIEKDQNSDVTKPDTTQTRTASGTQPVVPQGFRQAFDPRTGRFFLVVDSTAEKDTQNDITNRWTGFPQLAPSIPVIDQLPKGFRQVYDPHAGRFVLVLDSTTEKNEKDQKKDGSGSAIPHEVTALLSGGGLVTLVKGLQMLCERMGWFKKTQEATAAIAPTTATATVAATATATTPAPAIGTINPTPSKSLLVELAEIVSSPSSTSTKSGQEIK